MLIAALGSGRCHAPEQTRAALISAHVAGADVLRLSLRLTSDESVVVFEDATTDRATGQPGKVAEATLKALRALDVGATFTEADGSPFAWQARIESFGLLLDALPPGAQLLLHLRAEDTAPRREMLAKKAGVAIANRGLGGATVAASEDAHSLAAFAAAAHGARTVLEARPGANPAALIAAAVDAGAQGVMVPASDLAGANGALSGLAAALKTAHGSGQLPLGVVAVQTGRFSAAVHDALASEAFVWALGVESLLEAATSARPGWRWIDEEWAQKASEHQDVDSHIWKLGYAKFNPERYCHVFPDGGIVVNIKPFTGVVTYVPTGDPVAAELHALTEASWDAMRTWPFYSGGGAGFAPGVEGPFSAEVDIESAVACQATTVEMAAINVDPATHRPPWVKNANGDFVTNMPASFRDKHTFYDPHGAPPFVGVEHDEDDGWRINWNTGTDYDANQYGKAVGDGKLLTGRMRLDRRGQFWATYYRATGKTGALDWVCSGVARNGSLNDRVYLRLAGKRWRQEDPNNPSQWMPVVANRFTFRNFTLTRFP